jgi:hypothetical protein
VSKFIKIVGFLSILVCFQNIQSQTIHPDYQDGYLYINTHQKCTQFLKAKSLQRSSDQSLESDIDVLQFSKALKQYGFQSSDNFFAVLDAPVFQNTFEIKFSAFEQVESFISSLESCSCVIYAEKKPLWYPTFKPNDPFFNNQWTMNVTQAQSAWDVHKGAKREVVIAVVDDAIRISHEDLQPSLWVNKAEIPGNGIDDDENGYIDDINGFDVADNTSNPNPPPNNIGAFSHGTHCAGIATATTNNGKGVASLGYDSKLMAIKAKSTNNSGGGIDATDKGIVYAIKNKADVLSMSFGGGGNSSSIQNVFNFGKRQGTISMSSAGNDDVNLAFFPAAADNVLAVASTDWTDGKSGFSNYGDWVDISAPGSAIYSTFASNNSAYGNYSGTSMSCPNVAGLTGYLFSYHPNLTADDVLTCLLNGADNIDAQNPGYIGQLGAGRINAFNSINCLVNMPAQVRFGNPKIHYVNFPLSFIDKSINGTYSKWTIDNEEILASSFDYTFENTGRYPIVLEINPSTSKSDEITILPLLQVPYTVGSPGYQGDFESELTHFAVDHIQGSPLLPANSTYTGKNGTKSGSKAYVLAPETPFFQPNTFVNLYTPMFDFTRDGLYELTFYAKFDLGSGLDGFHVEYTIDGGKTWKFLGTPSSSWYNYTNTSLGIAFYLLGESYFSSRQTTFKQFRYNITKEVVGSNAAFRFVFNSQDRGNYIGFAIDDFEIHSYNGELVTKVNEFTGDYNRDRKIELTWTTKPEFYCKRFVVEMSRNGRDYQVEGVVKANNFSLVNNTYKFTTPAARNRDLYFYRLHVINEDDAGNYSNNFYTDAIVISKNKSEVEIFDYSPNPTSDFVGITFTQNLQTSLKARIFSATGQMVDEQILPAGQGYYQISLKQLIPATYIVYLEYGDNSNAQKAIKVLKI